MTVRVHGVLQGHRSVKKKKNYEPAKRNVLR